MTVVRTERHDGVVEVALCAPTRGNTIDFAWVDAFGTALRSVAEDDRCVLLRAEGPDFCYGGDIKTFVGDDPGSLVRSLADRFHVVLRVLDNIEIPVVAAVQGWAAGAGFSLACAADILLIAETTRFKTAYNALGITPDGGLTWHLPRRLPPPIALDLLLTSRILDAQEASRFGLAARVLPDADLEDAARALAVDIASRSRPSAIAVKRLVRAGLTADLSSQLDAEAEAIAAAAERPDGREGVTAFLEGRDPRFRK